MRQTQKTSENNTPLQKKFFHRRRHARAHISARVFPKGKNLPTWGCFFFCETIYKINSNQSTHFRKISCLFSGACCCPTIFGTSMGQAGTAWDKIPKNLGHTIPVPLFFARIFTAFFRWVFPKGKRVPISMGTSSHWLTLSKQGRACP